jgi:hypothetical protein
MRPDLEAIEARLKEAKGGPWKNDATWVMLSTLKAILADGPALLAYIRHLESRGAEGPAPGVDLAIVTQEKGWHGMPVRVLVSNGTTQEWYYCHGHPMAQVAAPAPEVTP